MALFNILISPLNAFPWVINGLVEAWVSNKRVNKFLRLNELDFSVYYDIQGTPATAGSRQKEGGTQGDLPGGRMGMSGSGSEMKRGVSGEEQEVQHSMDNMALAIKEGHFKWKEEASKSEKGSGEQEGNGGRSNDTGEETVEWTLRDVNITIQSVSGRSEAVYVY